MRPTIDARLRGMAFVLLFAGGAVSGLAGCRPGLPAASHGNEQEGHGHAHDDENVLRLSAEARKNIGLRAAKIKLQPYQRTVAVPAMVVERPGRSQVDVTAPITGVVTRIAPIEGQAVNPGDALFELRLTHEDLVTAQRGFLQSIEELDVVKAELARLGSIAEGVIEGRRLREQTYEQQKLEAALHAQRQGLLLHGLTNDQIDQIVASRTLLQGLAVVAPPYVEDEHRGELEHLFHVQEISVKRGQHVAAGERLGRLADHCELYIEGQAFEEDADKLLEAANKQLPVAVSPVSADGSPGQSEQLRILYLSDHVDSDSRALHFYMHLPNTVIRDAHQDGLRYIAWKYRPGQRMQVQVPVDIWENRVVLPVEAIVQEGPETYIFEVRGDTFVRVPVHVEYRDQHQAVIDGSESLVGRSVAVSGAYQMNLALKNQASGGVVAHGHSH